VVILSIDARPVRVAPGIFPEGAEVIDAHAELLRRLENADNGTYRKHYAHWRGEPPVLVDPHPNPEAHRIIAEAVGARIASRAVRRR
jgi:hypothetical protein